VGTLKIRPLLSPGTLSGISYCHLERCQRAQGPLKMIFRPETPFHKALLFSGDRCLAPWTGLEANDGPGEQPTKKGITLNIELLDDLKKAIAEAERILGSGQVTKTDFRGFDYQVRRI